PEPANADELHDGLVWLGFLTAEEVAARPAWRDFLKSLARERRAALLVSPRGACRSSKRSGRARGSSRQSPHPAKRRPRSRPTRRSSRSCAAGSKGWA